MKNLISRDNILLVVLAAVILYFVISCRKQSPMEVVKDIIGMSDDERQYADVSGENAKIPLDIGCAMKNGVGISSALLPREVATQEDFGQFAPDEILKGQNYLDPRSQIGYPETIGGSLRNANQQVRSEPPNPRMPVSIFNTSTIVPDQMRAKFEIGC